MAEQFSKGLMNMLLSAAAGDAQTGAGFKEIFNNAEVRIYGGGSATLPSVNAATSGYTVLAYVCEGASGGSTGDPVTWSDPADTPGTVYKGAGAWHDDAPTTGTMQFYRLVDKGDDDGVDSGSKPRIQGTIGSLTTDDMIVSSTAIGPGAFVINFFAQTILSS